LSQPIQIIDELKSAHFRLTMTEVTHLPLSFTLWLGQLCLTDKNERKKKVLYHNSGRLIYPKSLGNSEFNHLTNILTQTMSSPFPINHPMILLVFLNLLNTFPTNVRYSLKMVK
jgi:hypothetical protein